MPLVDDEPTVDALLNDFLAAINKFHTREFSVTAVVQLIQAKQRITRAVSSNAEGRKELDRFIKDLPLRLKSPIVRVILEDQIEVNQLFKPLW